MGGNILECNINYEEMIALAEKIDGKTIHKNIIVDEQSMVGWNTIELARAFGVTHSNAYFSIGLGAMSIHETFKENAEPPLSPREKKQKYKEGLHNMIKKGKRW